MKKARQLKRSWANRIATSSSTLVGVLGVLITLTHYFAIDFYLLRLGAIGEIILATVAALVAGVVAVFVDRSIRGKNIKENGEE